MFLESPAQATDVDAFLDAFATGDVCSLFFVVAIVIYIGHLAVRSRSDLRMGGLFVAGAAFLLLLGLCIYVRPPADATDLAGVLFRTLLASGIVLGLAWILLPGLSATLRFIVRSVRSLARVILAHCLAVLIGIAAAGFCYVRLPRDVPHFEVLGVSLLAGAAAAAIAQLLLIALLFIWRRIVVPPIRSLIHAIRWRLGAKKRLELAEAFQKRRTEEARATKRREDARIACELLYAFYGPKIANQFSVEAFDDFMGRYLSDGYPPELVEERAGQLQELLQRHYEEHRPPERFATMEDLGRWHREQTAMIENLQMSDEFKNVYTVQLNEAYSELMEQLFERTSQ